MEGQVRSNRKKVRFYQIAFEKLIETNSMASQRFYNSRSPEFSTLIAEKEDLMSFRSKPLDLPSRYSSFIPAQNLNDSSLDRETPSLKPSEIDYSKLK